jgi:hypothetical protein
MKSLVDSKTKDRKRASDSAEYDVNRGNRAIIKGVLLTSRRGGRAHTRERAAYRLRTVD